MSKVAMLAVRCPHCQAELKVSSAVAGKSISCPKCAKAFGIPASAAPKAGAAPEPAAKPSGPAAPDLRPVRCASCGAELRVPREKVGRSGACPRCGMQTRFENVLSAVEEFDLSKTDGNLLGKEVFLAQGEDVRSYKVMKELEEANKDSYAAAIMKAVVYPFSQIGAIAFFVIGIPVALTVVDLAGKSILSKGIDAGTKGDMTVHAITIVGLLVPLAIASFFCSFMLGVVRVTSQGRSSTPVVQGMAHRANLAAVCAWMALYFGLALFVGYRAGTAVNQAFVVSVPCLVLLAMGFFAAPMGLLCTANVSVSGGLNLPRVLSAIGAAFPAYMGCLGSILLSALFYGLLVRFSFNVAATTSTAWFAATMNFVGYLLMPMPLISLARAVGIFAQYHKRKLPLEMDAFSDAKAGALPTIVALVGVLFMYMPLHEANKQYVAKSELALTCTRQLQTIADKLSAGNRNSTTIPAVADLAAMEAKVGPELMKCPLDEKQLKGNPRFDDLMKPPFYVVVAQPGGRDVNANLMMVYEKASVFPDADRPYGGKVNAMLRTTIKERTVVQFRYDDALKLAEIVERLAKASNENDQQTLSREYERAFGAASSRAWTN